MISVARAMYYCIRYLDETSDEWLLCRSVGQVGLIQKHSLRRGSFVTAQVLPSSKKIWSTQTKERTHSIPLVYIIYIHR